MYIFSTTTASYFKCNLVTNRHKIVTILTFPQQVGGCGYPMIDTRLYINDWFYARGALVYLISYETNEIGGCAIEPRDREVAWKEKMGKKEKKRREKK